MNLICRMGNEEDFAALLNLWKNVFTEDSEEYIAEFLRAIAPEQHAVCGYVEEKLVGMLFLLPATVSYMDISLPVRYLYAGATNPAFRRKGIYGQLLQFAESVTASTGDIGIYLHPANQSLFSYYEKYGYRSGIDFSSQQLDKPFFYPAIPFDTLLADEGCLPDRKNCCVWLATGEGSALRQIMKDGAYTNILGE